MFTEAHVGVAIGVGLQHQIEPQIVSDSAGGAIIAWRDFRDGNGAFYAQRVSGAGNVQWTKNGVAVSKRASYQPYPEMISDDAGGAVFVWEDQPPGTIETDLYAQRIDSAGVLQWAGNAIPISMAAGEQRDAEVVADGTGGAIICWIDRRSGSDWDIYAQRVNSRGSVLWTADGVPVATAANDQYQMEAIADGAGGVIIVWTDLRSGTPDIYAQRMDDAGVVQWAANGIPISAKAGTQYAPRIVPDGSGGAIIVWRDGASNDIYAQRVNGAGALQWVANGVPIVTAQAHAVLFHVIPSSAGGAFIVWEEDDTSLRGQWVDNAGNLLWADNKSLGNRRWHSPYGVVSDGFGGFIIEWTGTLIRSDLQFDDDEAIFARRVSGAGDIQWDIVVRYYEREWDQVAPRLISDQMGGAIIAFQRNYVERFPRIEVKGSPDIYAHRVSASGQLQW